MHNNKTIKQNNQREKKKRTKNISKVTICDTVSNKYSYKNRQHNNKT